MSCLIIKNDGLGDLILSSGVIRSLAQHFNGAIDLVTCEQNKEIAAMIPGLRKVFLVSRDDLHFSAKLWKLGILYGCETKTDAAVLDQIHKERYDVAISLRRFIRQNTLVIMRSVRAKKRYCAWQFPTNATPRQAARSSRRWVHYQGSASILSEATYYQAFVKDVLGLTVDATPVLSFGDSGDMKPCEGKSVALGVAGNSINWSEDYWIELAQQLAAKGWRLGLFGGTDSRHLASRIATVVACENLTGQLGFKETARELKRYQFFIGNDTGLSHFASLMMKQVLVIYGGGTFRRFFPWPMAANQYLIYHGLTCFDCTWSCKHYQKYCLTHIKPGMVLKYFEDIVAGHAGHERDLNSENQQYRVGWQFSSNNIQAHIQLDKSQ